MKKEKYLPVGSVVLLEGATQKLVVIGYGVKSDETNELYDYAAAPYPIGVISNDQTLVFNHEQIKDVYYMGYSDEQYNEFNLKLNNLMEETKSNIGNNKQ